MEHFSPVKYGSGISSGGVRAIGMALATGLAVALWIGCAPVQPVQRTDAEPKPPSITRRESAPDPASKTPTGTVLFDFESDDDLRAWRYERKDASIPVKELARSKRFATSGRSSLQFSTPGYKPGMPQWPAFEGKPPLTDWSGYDALVFDVTNPTGFRQTLSLFVSDSKIPTRSGLSHRAVLPPLSYTEVVIPLKKLAEKKVNRSDIHVMHFFTSEPPGDMIVHVDRIALLKPGDAVPSVQAGYLRDFASLYSKEPDLLRQLLRDTGGRIKDAVAASPKVRDWVARSLSDLDRQVADLEKQIARADAAVLQAPSRRLRLQDDLTRIGSLAALRMEFERIAPSVRTGTEKRDDIAIGFATSMEKVLPRAMTSRLTVADRMELCLAQNEKESFQVIVIPCEQDLRKGAVRVTDLAGPNGARLAAGNVDAVVVGYVETKTPPPYDAPHVGWWPDPILDFQKAADIAKGDAQAFWVRVRAPKDQPAGRYVGKLEIVCDGRTAFSFGLAVRVFGFRLPDRSPLPMAVTFAPHDHPLPETLAQQKQWRESEDYPINAWKGHRLEWGDFLADYYLTYDSLYHRATPDFEILQRLQKQGRIGVFNLGYYGPVEDKPDAMEKWKAGTLGRLREGYDTAKALGLLSHAYIYGCDESKPEFFGGVQRAAAILKSEFPGVPVMTTAYDHSYGQDSVIKAVDAWCPLTPRFDMEQAAKARAAGKQVWWYICCGPHHPHANMFVEYPAIDGRLLMGAMTAKYRPDGFLYYQISIWNSQKPIESGPFTDWDPRSWTTYHGDGSWTCVGPGGTPLPTVRLENFRDGLEDYAYVRVLEATVARVEASPDLRAKRADWLKTAKGLLEVPGDVVKSLTEFTHDPAVVYGYRTRLAEAIESAGVAPAYPWETAGP